MDYKSKISLKYTGVIIVFLYFNSERFQHILYLHRDRGNNNNEQ
jgi:hypothetical protein